MTRASHWAALGAALIVSSCAAPATPPVTAPETAAKAAEKIPPKATSQMPPETAPDTEAKGTKAPDSVAHARPKPKPEPRLRAEDLIGLTDDRLAEVMGRPAFKRVDDPAALWQYRGARCILDLFLYADGPAYRVTHLEFRARSRDGAPGVPGGTINGRAAEQCFSDLLSEGGGKG